LDWNLYNLNQIGDAQFLKATTSKFYELLYYGSQVWLGSHTKVADVKKLNSVHYKLLIIVENDWIKGKQDPTWIELVDPTEPLGKVHKGQSCPKGQEKQNTFHTPLSLGQNALRNPKESR